MPAYRDVAMMLVDSGADIRSRYPYDANLRRTAGLQVISQDYSQAYSFPPDEAVRRASDFWSGDISLARAAQRNPYSTAGPRIVMPERFVDMQVPVYAPNIVDIPAGTPDSPTSIGLSFPGIRPDGTAFVVTLGCVAQDDPPPGVCVFTIGTYADNRGSWDGDVRLAGLPVTPTAGGAEFLPLRPQLEPVAFWMAVQSSVGDFAALTIGTDGDVQSAASKNLTIEANYDSRLEDLDTVVQYGTDGSGDPIDWRITSTSRNETSITVNLESVVV